MKFRIAPFIILYSTAHLLVDAACAFLLLGIFNFSDQTILALLLYNGLAFVLQAPFGYLIDKSVNPKIAAIAGLLLVASASLFWDKAFFAITIMGIGNALFHVGGGSQVLAIKKKTATYAGLFVAPGAIGLAIGTRLAVSQVSFGLIFFPIILVVMGVLLIFINKPDFERKKERINSNHLFVFIAFLILITIVVRSLVGMAIAFPWKENIYLGLLLTASVFLGKFLGGVLTDRLGPIKTGMTGLLIAAPLLAYCQEIPILAIIGIIMFNFTMPVTLIALLNIMPDKKGLTFGLSTTALFLGALPVILNQYEWVKNTILIFLLIIMASFSLFIALYLSTKPKQININS